jgi:hypothetical protein
MDWEDYASSAEEDEEAEEDAQVDSPGTDSPSAIKTVDNKDANRTSSGPDGTVDEDDELSEEVRRLQLKDKDKDSVQEIEGSTDEERR